MKTEKESRGMKIIAGILSLTAILLVWRQRREKKRQRRHVNQILCFALISSMVLVPLHAFAAQTPISGCSKGGTVTATYEKTGSAANGYYKPSGNIIIKYTADTSKEQCSDAKWGYIGATNEVSTPKIQGNNVSEAGHRCNGHTSTTAEWTHYMGVTGTTLYGLKSGDTTSLVLTEAQFKNAKYVVTGPIRTHGNGLQNGKYPWVGQYQTMPAMGEIISGDIDKDPPEVTGSFKAAGTTAVNGGKIWGTKATLSATATDDKSRPAKSNPFRWYKGSTALSDGRGSNSSNAKSTSTTLDVTENVTYFVEAVNQLGLTSKQYKIEVDCIDLTAPTISSFKTNSSSYAQSHVLTVAASDGGSGLHASAYSWDNGATWTSSNTKTITANGTYTVRVRDKLGNTTAAKSVTVNNIDRTAPNVALEIDNEDWAKTHDLTAIATDMQSGIADKGYSWDDKATWTAEDVLTVSENGLYSVSAKDKADNQATASIEVTKIDKTAPTFSYFEPSVMAYAQEHTLVVEAFDTQSGLAAEAYSWDDGETWSEDNTKTVTENGEYTVQVRDVVGNINDTDGVYELSLIDRGKPIIISQSQTPTTWTNGDVELSVTTKDEGGGLAAEAYRWDNATEWTSSNTKVVTDNGNYAVQIRDVAGNTTTAEFTVTNIDKKAPIISKVTYPTKGWLGKEKIVVTAKDNESGLASKAYSWDNGETWTSKQEISITKGGSYYIAVRDVAGNITKKKITASKPMIPLPEKPSPEPTPTKPTPEKPSPSIPKPTKPTSPTPPTKNVASKPTVSKAAPAISEKTVSENEIDEDEEIEEEEKEVEEIAVVPPVYEIDTIDKKPTNWKAVMAAVAAAIFIVFFFLLFWLNSVKVYGKTFQNDDKYLGRALKRRIQKRYRVSVSARVLSKNETNTYVLKLGTQFADNHENEPLEIKLPEDEIINTTIQEEVTFHYGG